MYTSYRYGYIASKNSLSNFTKKYKQTLQKEIFGRAFDTAKKCEEINVESNKQTCRKQVSTQIARSLREEELAPGGYDLPNDLFFIKQEGKKFLRLGWEGKLEDITLITNTYLFKYMNINNLFPPSEFCNYFGSFQTQSGSACEYFVKLDLPNIQKGYIARQYPKTEEDHYLLLLFFIPFEAIQSQNPIAIIILLVPILLSVCFVFYYSKRRNKNLS